MSCFIQDVKRKYCILLYKGNQKVKHLNSYPDSYVYWRVLKKEVCERLSGYFCFLCDILVNVYIIKCFADWVYFKLTAFSFCLWYLLFGHTGKYSSYRFSWLLSYFMMHELTRLCSGTFCMVG